MCQIPPVPRALSYSRQRTTAAIWTAVLLLLSLVYSHQARSDSSFYIEEGYNGKSVIVGNDLLYNEFYTAPPMGGNRIDYDPPYDPDGEFADYLIIEQLKEHNK